LLLVASGSLSKLQCNMSLSQVVVVVLWVEAAAAVIVVQSLVKTVAAARGLSKHCHC
jgi:hypothetical protein